jgi:hypothetical protein
MQAYYRTLQPEGGPISPDERQALRRAMIDYGALQPSPVHKPVDAKQPDLSIVRDSHMREVSPPPPSPVPPTPSNPHSIRFPKQIHRP